MGSGIILHGDSTHDGIWEVREIAGSAFDCPLVFLNLCPENGGGNRSSVPVLPTAFQFAGCSKVIAPLWKVDDLAAAVTAKLFYRYLREYEAGENSEFSGLKELLTLRRAQMAVRDRVNAHPAYWAGYIMLY
jgi:CHAT domain-containing protein